MRRKTIRDIFADHWQLVAAGEDFPAESQKINGNAFVPKWGADTMSLFLKDLEGIGLAVDAAQDLEIYHEELGGYAD